jgi:hypothetical protein
MIKSTEYLKQLSPTILIRLSNTIEKWGNKKSVMPTNQEYNKLYSLLKEENVNKSNDYLYGTICNMVFQELTDRIKKLQLF